MLQERQPPQCPVIMAPVYTRKVVTNACAGLETPTRP